MPTDAEYAEILLLGEDLVYYFVREMSCAEGYEALCIAGSDSTRNGDGNVSATLAKKDDLVRFVIFCASARQDPALWKLLKDESSAEVMDRLSKYSHYGKTHLVATSLAAELKRMKGRQS